MVSLLENGNTELAVFPNGISICPHEHILRCSSCLGWRRRSSRLKMVRVSWLGYAHARSDSHWELGPAESLGRPKPLEQGPVCRGRDGANLLFLDPRQGKCRNWFSAEQEWRVKWVKWQLCNMHVAKGNHLETSSNQNSVDCRADLQTLLRNSWWNITLWGGTRPASPPPVQKESRSTAQPLESTRSREKRRRLYFRVYFLVSTEYRKIAVTPKILAGNWISIKYVCKHC